MNELVIRPLNADDGLAPLLQQCKAFFVEYSEHEPDFFRIGELHDEDLAGRFINSITDESSCTLLAMDGDRLAGYCSVVVREQPRFWAVRLVGAIQGLYVEPAYRRQGIAMRLLDAAKAWFQERSSHYYTVYTACANEAAVATYHAAGMTPLQTVFLGETHTGASRD